MSSLAIVIPAYSPEFFRAALESLAAQTDRRFRLYVGDDAGPPSIASTVQDFSGALDVVYQRYDENLGGRSLVAHWNRCVALANEPWIWLFSDDDVMAPTCVASFHAARETGNATDVLRFDTEVIDAEGRLVRANPRHPAFESGVDFVFGRLSGARHSYVVEYVFRRDAFEREGGFPEYPAAWCADDAAWFLFAGDRGIRTLPTGSVSWRASGRNISTSPTRHRPEKLAAATSFLRFVESDVIPRDTGSGRTREDWSRARERWYVEQLRYPVPIGPSLWLKALRASRSVWRVGTLRKVATLSLWNAQAKYRALVRR
jgi:glycosyltransferase involved in cell wall biosynthesis